VPSGELAVKTPLGICVQAELYPLAGLEKHSPTHLRQANFERW